MEQIACAVRLGCDRVCQVGGLAHTPKAASANAATGKNSPDVVTTRKSLAITAERGSTHWLPFGRSKSRRRNPLTHVGKGLGLSGAALQCARALYCCGLAHRR